MPQLFSLDIRVRHALVSLAELSELRQVLLVAQGVRMGMGDEKSYSNSKQYMEERMAEIAQGLTTDEIKAKDAEQYARNWDLFGAAESGAKK